MPDFLRPIAVFFACAAVWLVAGCAAFQPCVAAPSETVSRIRYETIARIEACKTDECVTAEWQRGTERLETQRSCE